MSMCSIFIRYFAYRGLSWKPKTQPNGSSTRFTRKKLDHTSGIYISLFGKPPFFFHTERCIPKKKGLLTLMKFNWYLFSDTYCHWWTKLKLHFLINNRCFSFFFVRKNFIVRMNWRADGNNSTFSIIFIFTNVNICYK